MVGHVSIKSRSAALKASLALSFLERSTLPKILPSSFWCLRFSSPSSLYSSCDKSCSIANLANFATLQKTKKALSSLRRLSSKSYLVWLLKDLIYFHCISLRKQVEVSVYLLVELYCDHMYDTHIRRKG